MPPVPTPEFTPPPLYNPGAWRLNQAPLAPPVPATASGTSGLPSRLLGGLLNVNPARGGTIPTMPSPQLALGPGSSTSTALVPYAPPVGSTTGAAGGRFSQMLSGIRSVTGRGTQISGPKFPGWVSGSRLANLARGPVGRGALGLGIWYGGDALSDAFGGDETAAGSITSATQLGGSVGSAFGAPGALTGAIGMGLGEITVQSLGEFAPGPVGDFYQDRSVTNVGENVARKFNRYDASGTLEKNYDALNAAGITVSDIASAISHENPKDAMASLLAHNGFEGATLDGDGGVDVKGPALDLVNEIGNLSENSEEAGSLATFIGGLSERGLSETEMNEAIGLYTEILNTKDADNKTPDPEDAAVQALSRVDQALALDAEAQVQERSQLAEIAAFQAQARQYMAPVTGRMRAQADANLAMMQETMANSNLPPAMANALALQTQHQYDQQMQMANAYDAQIAAIPQMLQLQEQQAQQEMQANLDAQFQSQLISRLAAQQVEAMNPAGGTGATLDVNALLNGTAPTPTIP